MHHFQQYLLILLYITQQPLLPSHYLGIRCLIIYCFLMTTVALIFANDVIKFGLKLFDMLHLPIEGVYRIDASQAIVYVGEAVAQVAAILL